MRFIPLSTIRSVTESFGDVTSIEGREAVLKSLKDSSGQFFTGPYTKEEIIDSVSKITDRNCVFYQWIEQEKNLLAILEGRVPEFSFQDRFHWVDHTLFTDFTDFLSPFLVSGLMKYRDTKDFQQLKKIFSFLVLLPKDNRSVLEQELFRSPKEYIVDHLKQLQNCKNENDLLHIIDNVSSDDLIAIIDLLSRSSYHVKVWYIDEVLAVLNHPSCTARLAYRIVQRLKKLELNPEHQSKIIEIENELKSGELLNKASDLPLYKRLRIKQIMRFAFFICLLIVAYFIIQYDPTSITEKDLGTVSSFEDFSLDERKQLDSLLRLNSNATQSEDIDQDQYMWTQGNGISLSLRKSLKNKRMESLFSDWLLNADLHNKGLVDSCAVFKQKTAHYYPDVHATKEMLGKEETMIRNESTYSVYVFIFEEFSNGKIYSVLIPSETSVALKLSKDQYLFFVAGNNLAPFIAPKGVPESELPSKEFTHHFCDVDMNFAESLGSFYKLSSPKKDHNKLLITGDSNTFFLVTDLYGILETI